MIPRTSTYTSKAYSPREPFLFSLAHVHVSAWRSSSHSPRAPPLLRRLPRKNGGREEVEEKLSERFSLLQSVQAERKHTACSSFTSCQRSSKREVLKLSELCGEEPMLSRVRVSS
ncbi:hypothetical protein SRHO_G00309300 [Serrasalmus rhombeus]